LGSYFGREIPRQTDFEVEYLQEEVYDEELDMVLLIKFVCACDSPVVKMNEDMAFICLHCDMPCRAGNCGMCKRLNAFDFGI